MTLRPVLRIGTRGSRLALAQAELVRAPLAAAHPELAEAGGIEVVAIKTTGDKVQDRPLAEIGGKGLFAKEIEEALLAGRIDMAVHSMKDMETRLAEGLAIGCVLEREDPRDVLISRDGSRLADLEPGALIGTASVRRQALVLNARPDLRVVNFRGNVETRLRKLEDGRVDATLLALAGLRRLGMADIAAVVLEPEEFLPAVAQGAIGVEIRAGDERARALLAPLNHVGAATEVTAERALLAALDGSCRTPIAALARLEPAGGLWLRALVAIPDGSELWRAERRGTAADAEALGRDAGEELRRRAGPALFDKPV
ncbi:MAG: hydroxymethylbilane synthase [Proteobacteria bacterium]|nr:hydroxymethylbilane synthase [Pseudomonadota bacterium]